MTQLIERPDGRVPERAEPGREPTQPDPAGAETGSRLRMLLAVAAPVVLAAGGLAAATAGSDTPVVALVVIGIVLAVPLLLRHPSAVLVVMVVVQVANLSSVADAQGVPDTFLGLTLVAAACVVLTAVRDGRGPVWSPVLLFGAIYAALRLLSTLGATDLTEATDAMQGLIGDLVLIALLLALCRRHRGETAIAMSAVATAAVLCLLELLRQFVVGNDVTFGLLRPATIQDVGLSFPRHTGPVADFNFWARILVLILPFSFSLFADRSFGAHRWWWFGSAILLFGGIYLSGSRGALLAAGVVVVAWLAVSGARYRRLLVGLPVVLVGLIMVPGVGTRLASVGNVSTTSAGSADESLTGRLGALRAGLHMIAEHPLLGVGPDNFITAFPVVARQYGIDSLVLAPHNMYLQIAAESGIPALLAWLAFLGAGVVVAVRARCLLGAVRTPSGVPSPEALLAGAAIASLVGWLVAGVVLHVDNLRILAIPLVLAASLDISARRSAAMRLGAPDGWRPGMLLEVPARTTRPRRARRFLVPLGVGAVVGLACAVAVGVGVPRWTTTAQVALDVAPGRGELDSYAVEVLNRAPLSSTYLAVLSEPALIHEAGDAAGLPPEAVQDAQVTASATSDPTSMTVSVTSGTEATSSALATATARATTDRFRSFGALYTLTVSGVDAPVATVRPNYPGLAGAAGAAVVAFLLTLSVRGRLSGRAGHGVLRRRLGTARARTGGSRGGTPA